MFEAVLAKPVETASVRVTEVQDYSEESIRAEILGRLLHDAQHGALEPLEKYEQEFAHWQRIVREEFASVTSREQGGESQKNFGPYVLIELVGIGGQGRVFRAQDGRTHEVVALKILNPFPSKEQLDRFQREALVTGDLGLANVPRTRDSGVIEGIPYLAMEFVDGATLEFVVTQKAGIHFDSIDSKLDFFSRLSRIVHDAHLKGVVHRDLKPKNVMIDHSGACRILDFGLVRFGEEGGGGITQSGDLLGTPEYMSPEQITRQSIRPDHRTDIWSLGVMLYECLSNGAKPFRGTTREALYQAILHGTPNRIELGDKKLTKRLKTIFEVALSKNRDKRYQTALAFAEDLERVRLGGEAKASQPTRFDKLKFWAQRNPLLASAVGLCIFLSIATVTLLVFLWRDSEFNRIREINLRKKAERERLDKERLLDEALFPHLRDWKTRLWPLSPELISREEGANEWLSIARELSLRSATNPDFDSRLKQLTNDIREVEKRVREVERVDSVSMIQSADAWAQAIQDIAGPRSSSPYDGLLLQPQWGFVPLGRNVSTGLQEFWFVPSGARPKRSDSNQRGEGMVFVLLPGGAFQTGPEERGSLKEERRYLRRKIRLGAFFVSKFEVTQDQWTRIIGSNPSAVHPDSNPGLLISPSHPVENMTRHMAEEFCNRLGLMLPTEEQWEYAAYAGTKLEFSWGKQPADLEGRANVADMNLKKSGRVGAWGGVLASWDDGFPTHAPVDAFPANKFGLFGVMGNVAEWCRGKFTTSLDAKDEGVGTSGVYRGGSWYTGPDFSRIGRRWKRDIASRAPNLGLRPVVPLSSRSKRAK